MIKQSVLRTESPYILGEFLEWFEEFRRPETRLVTLEGLPHAGKSTLLSMLPQDSFSTLELDNIVQRPANSNLSWSDCIPISEVMKKLHHELSAKSIVAVEGPAVWQLSQKLFKDFERCQIVRVYLKQMSRTGDFVDWLAGDILNDYGADTRPYFRSIWEHHANRIWEQCDLILERLPE